MPGADNLTVEARAALLDAVAALVAHKASVILIGAQAIYLRTGNATFALAEATKDSDLAIDTRELGEDPLLEEAMTSAGFILNPVSRQPGAWMSPNGIPVDLMVPEHLAGSGSRRGVRIPPHAKHSARRAAGLEAALIDQSPMTVDSLERRRPQRRHQRRRACGTARGEAPQAGRTGRQLPTVSTTRTRTTSTACWLPPRLLISPRPCSGFTPTRSPKGPQHKRWATWSNSSQAQTPSVPRWPVAPRKESASQTRSRLRSASSHRTCC